ncbi:capsid protein [Paenibacillus stellifer]|uniref:Capsid protein n=1 Tax=Paenibacillus stellifer TaxID=169760 RepID=A0A089LJY4_9BACL|nr:phage major capsid protein [Paenibacillus stellifer]AIQ61851.1 capsid protein [Paenibacillus stellifer]
MNLQQLLQARAAKIDRQGEMLNKAKTEARDLTNEEETEFDGLEAEIAELDNKIKVAQKRDERLENHEARMRDLDNSSERPYRNPVPGPAPSDKKENYGFSSFGEFVDAVRFGDNKGRLRAIRNDFSMGSGTEGGFAVPEQFREEILQLMAEQSVVRPRAQVIPPGTPPDAKITIPSFVQGANGAYGGATVSWIAEGGAKPKTSAELGEITLEPYEVAAHVIVTDKLLRNWSAASAFIRNLLSQAMVAAEDTAFLKGDGTGKPTGVIPAAGRVLINRATASKISYLDLVAMRARFLPNSLENAIWVVAQSALPQIMTLQDPNGNYIFINGDASKGIPATLMGIPIRFTGKTGPLGQVGDVSLLDLSYYLIKDGSGPFIQASEHVEFVNNKTVIKCFWNVDGKPWVATPLKLEDGVTTASPYVVLGAPSV